MFYHFWKPLGMLEWVRMAFSDKLVQEKLMGLFLKRTEKGKSRPPPVAV